VAIHVASKGEQFLFAGSALAGEFHQPPPSGPAIVSSNVFHPIHIPKSAIAAPASPSVPSAIRRVTGESAGGAARRRAGNL